MPKPQKVYQNRISIGDLPIALETFTTWFNEIIGDPDRRQIPFHLFLTNLLKKIIAKNTTRQLRKILFTKFECKFIITI